MGFVNKNELENFCDTILKSSRIREKVVILCEGDIENVKRKRSPQSFRQMEKIQDSAFYKHSVPQNCQAYKPQFFNCGDRNGVIDCYFKLLELNVDNENSYLNSDLLFAIIDLDIQSKNIANYQFNSTEEIYKNLYNKFSVNQTNAINHRIFITGLIHKEAYFLLPELKDIYSDFLLPVKYNNRNIEFEDIYKDMAQNIPFDADLNKKFNSSCDRINHLNTLDYNNSESLKSTWLNIFENSNTENKNNLILALLTIKKAKDLWKKIIIEEDKTANERQKEQLILKIAAYYSKLESIPNNHIPYFFQNIKNIIKWQNSDRLGGVKNG